MNQPRGPYRKIARKERVGQHGSSHWLIQLQCGHTVARSRNPGTGRITCRECVPDKNAQEDVLDMSQDVAKLDLANMFGINPDQVTWIGSAAQIVLDPYQVKKLLLENKR